MYTQVRQLEERLGLPLFETVGKKIYLTDAGHELVVRSHSISAERDDLVHAFQETKGVERGSLRFETSSTTIPFISELLARFFKDHPAIDLRIDLVIVAPIDHPLTKRKSIPLKEVVDNEFMRFVAEQSTGTWPLKKLYKLAKISPY